ncbi:DNA gyrase inhibitor YacG [Roseicitreum antarcticum]|uniref:DNA gyrase inhibitor YacG n=1 Tax=Roseicitreum antarcticum TaxID=564137 RepID=A0A1H2VZF9_9RHOB|nr:DNA gyrase inhibitor YacG [Roseicitreum antarcticum]SDW73671.1 hypothetical protein SAMN04488238_103221 [Roseicitreum antarcticum]
MTCPICKKPTSPEYKPFCSRRCADVDLARWLREDYRIPGPPSDPFEDPFGDQQDDPDAPDGAARTHGGDKFH